MGDFLSPAALKVVAVNYQQGLLGHLNERIKGAPCRAAFLSLVSFLNELTCEVGTKFKNMNVAQIVISTAPHESQTLAFNNASLALDNSFPAPLREPTYTLTTMLVY
jgi:superoxide dismutase, Fe-Mn family